MQRASWIVAIGSGWVFEGSGPERMGEERRAFEKHYPWIPPDCLEFFRAHEYHDEGHGNFIQDVLGQYCMEEHLQEEMLEVVRQRTDVMWLQNESIYTAIGRPEFSSADVEELVGSRT